MTRKYMVATDVGGTCTDTIVFAAGEPAHLGKTLSTPPDFSVGVIHSIRSAADAMGISLADLLTQTSLFMHGSTVVDNTILTREGARTGLITTRGFEDTVLMTRGAYGRWGGLTEDRIKHPVKTERAQPLVAPDCIVGVPERADYKGAIIQELDEAAAEAAIRFLIDSKEVEAIAVSFLWSFYNPDNERKIKKLVERIAPKTYCTLSSDIAPIPGEYERSSTAVINAYAGRITNFYLSNLQNLLTKAGYGGPVTVMQGYGGLLPAQDAADRSIGMLECGPAAGVIGSRVLGQLLDQPDVIATDMGGTTFKVAVIQNGEIEYAREPMVDRFHYSQPKIEVVSIGSGGGSIVWLEPGTHTPRVRAALGWGAPGSGVLRPRWNRGDLDRCFHADWLHGSEHLPRRNYATSSGGCTPDVLRNDRATARNGNRRSSGRHLSRRHRADQRSNSRNHSRARPRSPRFRVACVWRLVRHYRRCLRR